MIQILVMALACWRITLLIHGEVGPYGIIEKVRHLLGVRYNEHSMRYGTNELANLINCPWCLSIWVGLVLAISFVVWEYAWLAMLPFALSAVAILMGEVVEWQ